MAPRNAEVPEQVGAAAGAPPGTIFAYSSGPIICSGDDVAAIKIETIEKGDPSSESSSHHNNNNNKNNNNQHQQQQQQHRATTTTFLGDAGKHIKKMIITITPEQQHSSNNNSTCNINNNNQSANFKFSSSKNNNNNIRNNSNTNSNALHRQFNNSSNSNINMASKPATATARVTVIKDFEYLIMKMSEANGFLLRKRERERWPNDRDGHNLRQDSFGSVWVRGCCWLLLPGVFLCHSCC